MPRWSQVFLSALESMVEVVRVALPALLTGRDIHHERADKRRLYVKTCSGAELLRLCNVDVTVPYLVLDDTPPALCLSLCVAALNASEDQGIGLDF